MRSFMEISDAVVRGPGSWVQGSVRGSRVQPRRPAVRFGGRGVGSEVEGSVPRSRVRFRSRGFGSGVEGSVRKPSVRSGTPDHEPRTLNRTPDPRPRTPDDGALLYFPPGADGGAT